MPYHQSAEDLHIDDEVHAGADDEVVLLDLLAEHDGVNATTTGRETSATRETSIRSHLLRMRIQSLHLRGFTSGGWRKMSAAMSKLGHTRRRTIILGDGGLVWIVLVHDGKHGGGVDLLSGLEGVDGIE